MLKEFRTTVTRPITKIINLSILQNMFQSMWKSAVITPIFNSGDPHSKSNYKPINILPAGSKIAEKLIVKLIINHLNNTPYALHPVKFGFRSNYSTKTATCFFTENIRALLD